MTTKLYYIQSLGVFVIWLNPFFVSPFNDAGYDVADYYQAARWVTFDLLRSLFHLDESGDWLNLEPRTPFQPYPKREKRF